MVEIEKDYGFIYQAGIDQIASSSFYTDYGGNLFIDSNITLNDAIIQGKLTIKDDSEVLVGIYDSNDVLILKVDSLNHVLTINGDIIPSTTSARDLGSGNKYWRNLYVDDIYGKEISLKDDSSTILNILSNDSTDVFNVDSVDFISTFNTDLIPYATGLRDLGSGTKYWRNLYIGSTYLSNGIIYGKNSERIEIGATDDYIDFIGSAGTNNQTIRFDLDDTSGPRFSTTTGSALYFDDQVYINATDDNYGRLLKIQKAYSLGGSYDQTATESQVDIYTHGARVAYGLNLQVRDYATNATQTGALTGVYGNIYVAGGNNITGEMRGGEFIIGINNAYTHTKGIGVRLYFQGYDTKAYTVTDYNGLYSSGTIQDGTVTTFTHIYLDEPAKDTGSIGTIYGLFIKEFDVATNNYEIWMDLTAGIFFRASTQYIYSSASSTLDIVSPTINMGSATTNRIKLTAGDAGGTPSNTTSVNKWLTVLDSAGATFYIPLYQ